MKKFSDFLKERSGLKIGDAICALLLKCQLNESDTLKMCDTHAKLVNEAVDMVRLMSKRLAIQTHMKSNSVFIMNSYSTPQDIRLFFIDLAKLVTFANAETTRLDKIQRPVSTLEYFQIKNHTTYCITLNDLIKSFVQMMKLVDGGNCIERPVGENETLIKIVSGLNSVDLPIMPEAFDNTKDEDLL